LSAAFLWQPILTGRVFVPADLAYTHDYMWKVHSEKVGIDSPRNPVLSDVPLYYYPYATYAISRLSEGEFPLWNPYILTGAPFFATAQAAVLEPVNLLTFLAGPHGYWTWAALLHMTMLGFTTFGFVRALGRSLAAGVAAGVVMMACGFVTVWLNYTVVATLAWTPAIFWTTTRLLQTGRVVWMAGAALCMGGLLLGGHPETQFLVGLMWGAYSLYSVAVARREGPARKDIVSESLRSEPSAAQRLKSRATEEGSPPTRTRLVQVDTSPRRGTLLSSSPRLQSLGGEGQVFRPFLKQIGLLAGAALLGLAIAAVQTFTFLDLLLSSSAISERASPLAPFDLGQTILRLAVLFFPNFSGTPLRDNYWVSGAWTNFNEQTGYIGLLAVALAGLGAAYWWRRDRLVPFFGVMVVLAVLFAIRAPGFHLIRALPVFNVGHGVRWVIVLSFFGAVLAGYGVDALLAMRARSKEGRNAWLWLAGASFVALGTLLTIYIGIRYANWDQAWQPLISHVKMAFLFNPTRMTMYWPAAFLAAGAAATLAWWRGWIPGKALAALLVLLMYADLWAFGSQYNPVIAAEAVYPPTETISYAQENLGHDRFVGAAGMMWPNTPMLFSLRDLRGYEDVVDQPFAALFGTFKKALDPAPRKDLEFTASENRLLQLAGVRYIITPRKPRVNGDAGHFRPVMEEASDRAIVATYEMISTLPRAYIVFNGRVAPDLQTATNMLLDPQHDPRQAVVLIGETEPLRGPALDAPATPVRWIRDAPEETTLEVTLPAPGYLVLSDNYANGWEASVDGNPTPILRANVVFRAVSVPSGTHTVSFVYRPRLFYGSALVSGIGVALALLIAVAHLVRSVRRRSPVG
jgi:hypothetical protein